MLLRQFFSRISLSLISLVIVPWAVVLAAHIRVKLMPPIPVADIDDQRELAQIAAGLQSLRARYGAYPPDFTSGNPAKEIDDYLKRRFPKRDAIADLPVNVDKLGPENALHFWMEGLYVNNPEFPFTGKIPKRFIPMTEEEMETAILASDMIQALLKTGETEETVWRTRQFEDQEKSYRRLMDQQHRELAELNDCERIHDLDIARLSKTKTYRPRSSLAPLVYFRHDSYDNASFQGQPQWGVAKPYQSEVSKPENKTFVKPKDFQIIGAGRDSRYGDQSIRAMDAAFYDAHSDNMVSFSSHPLGLRVRTDEIKKATNKRTTLIYMALICMAVYPFIAAIRWKEDGLRTLSRNIQRQWNETGTSERWQGILHREKKIRRANAIDRFTTAEKNRPRRITFNASAEGVKKPQKRRAPRANSGHNPLQ